MCRRIKVGVVGKKALKLCSIIFRNVEVNYIFGARFIMLVISVRMTLTFVAMTFIFGNIRLILDSPKTFE